jgi:hypothetical protein
MTRMVEKKGCPLASSCWGGAMSISTRRLPRNPAPPITTTTLPTEVSGKQFEDVEVDDDAGADDDSDRSASLSAPDLQKLDTHDCIALLLYAATQGLTLRPMAPTLVSGTQALLNCG